MIAIRLLFTKCQAFHKHYLTLSSEELFYVRGNQAQRGYGLLKVTHLTNGRTKPEHKPVGSESFKAKTEQRKEKLPFDILSHCHKPELQGLEEFPCVSKNCTAE